MIQRLLVALGLALGLSLGAWWLQGSLFSSDGAAQGPSAASSLKAPSDQSPEHLEVKVLKVEGLVERGGGGQWEALRVGDVLNSDSVIRSRDGSAALAFGEKAQIEVTEDSQFRVGELSSKLSQVKLEGGRIEARVHGGEDGRLAVAVMGSDTVAQASDGEFAVMRGEDAQVTVASRRGAVEVAAKGERVTVRAGQQSVVRPKRSPSIPQKIPSSLFLKLSKLPAKRIRKRQVVVEGETAVGAIVSINGVTVSSDEGRFVVQVPLKEGENQLKLSAKDALGRREDKLGPKVFVDSRPPKNNGRVLW